MPSKQSIMGDRYTLPAGIRNSEISVGHISFGAPALKSRFRRLSGAGLDQAVSGLELPVNETTVKSRDARAVSNERKVVHASIGSR